MQEYLEVFFTFPDREGWKDILIAELDFLGYDSFEELPSGLRAYVCPANFREEELQELKAVREFGGQMRIEISRVEQKNWNAIWESGFDPIEVGRTCRIRAPFHEPSDCTYELVIQPKMSFGTGHHATTYLMVEYLLEDAWEGCSVLDMGCGTGILGILAELRGASPVEAVDIDPWCVENALENIELNHCRQTRVWLREDWTPRAGGYDRILANINKNVLLLQLAEYAKILKKGGSLYLSGFYEEDLGDIDRAAAREGLIRKNYSSKDHWVSAKYVY